MNFIYKLNYGSMMKNMRRFLFALALVSSASYSLSASQPDAYIPQNRIKTEQRGSDKFPIVVKITPDPEADANAAEEKQNRRESAIQEVRVADATYFLAVVTMLLAVFTGGLWFVTYRLAKDAKDTSKRQAEEMKNSLNLADEAIRTTRDAYIASERPWISVEAIVDTDLIRKDGNVEFGIRFTVKNHGSSPAINVRVCYEVVALRVAADPFGGARARVENLRNNPVMNADMGIQLFPSETTAIRWRSPLTKQEIETARVSNFRQGYLPSIYAIGSVFYQSPFGNEIYQTGFNYYVLDMLQPGGGDLPDFDGSISGNHIALISQPYAKGSIS